MNGRRSALPAAGHLVERRLDDLLLTPRAGEVRLARGRAGSGGCVSTRAHGGRPCAASPRSKRQPRHSAHRFAVAYGQSNLFDRIGRGTSTSIPPTASISSPKRSKSTNATWFTSSPVSPFDGAERERRAADLVRRVDLREPDLRDVHLEVARDRQEGESPLAGIGADEHDRVGPVGALRARLVPAVGAEHEDRRRVRDQQPVGRRELAADAGGTRSLASETPLETAR